ncbi:MAG TPA: response regulator [Gemmataceae bacterium]|nr:response regulator [Gemmataceae bacterium]
MNAVQIALIDDDRSWLEALAEYLETKGFSVCTAADPAEGLALLSQKNVAVVICDYDMPGMTGLELVRSIFEQPRSIAILMVSNEEDPSLAARALAAGACGFLTKTGSPSQLLQKVRQILAKRETAAPASQLHLWQRLLPSPHRMKHGRNQRRPAARAHLAPCTKSSKLR